MTDHLRAMDEARCREYAFYTGHEIVKMLLRGLDASRAESAALRAAVAEAEKQRDEANKPWNFRLMLPDPVDTYDAVDCRLVDTGHFDRLLILESGELNERLEELTASRDALAAELAEARKVVDDAVPFIACHGAVERVKEHGNIESAENSEAILYRMLLLLGNHGAIERLGLKPAARDSGKASGGGGGDGR